MFVVLLKMTFSSRRVVWMSRGDGPRGEGEDGDEEYGMWCGEGERRWKMRKKERREKERRRG